MTMRPIRRGLPTNVAASVGRIISRWCYQEYLLYVIAYTALGVTIKQGRIAVRQGSIREQFTMIEDLLLLRRIVFPAKQISKLADKIEKTKKKRDGLAHSLYMDTERGIALQDTKSPPWQVKAPKHLSIRHTKKMDPGLILLDRAYLSGVRKDIEHCIKETERLRRAVLNALATWQQRQIA